jgi:hypothetical protein
VEVPLCEQGVNLESHEKKSERSADASGARSQAPFSLPKEAPQPRKGFKKTLFIGVARKLAGNGQANGRRSDQAGVKPGSILEGMPVPI